MRNKFLSTSAIKRILKKIDNVRVSNGACLELKKYLEFQAIIIGKIAIKNALYEGRKSVKDRDIKEAIKEIEEQA